MVRMVAFIVALAACTDGLGTSSQNAVVIDGGRLVADEISVIKTVTNSTVSYVPAIRGVVNGSFDTSASGLNAVGVMGECNAVRALGSNTLICSSVYGHSTGGAPDNRAVRGVVNNYEADVVNFAGVFSNTSSGARSTNWGVYGGAVGVGGAVNYGGYFTAGGAASNWALYTVNAKSVLGANGWDVILYGDIRLGGETGPIVRSGYGSPEGYITAPVGSMFSRTDGSPGSTFYVKESDGTGNTGWSAK